jgi:hypothetical protein
MAEDREWKKVYTVGVLPYFTHARAQLQLGKDPYLDPTLRLPAFFYNIQTSTTKNWLSLKLLSNPSIIINQKGPNGILSI